MRKQIPSPTEAMSAPPIAGPMKRVPFMAVEFKAMALLRSEGGTSFE